MRALPLILLAVPILSALSLSPPTLAENMELSSPSVTLYLPDEAENGRPSPVPNTGISSPSVTLFLSDGADLPGAPFGLTSLGLTLYSEAPVPERCSGDLDADGGLTVGDAVLALQVTVGLRPQTPAALAAADCDRDGGISVSDGVILLRRIVGLDN